MSKSVWTKVRKKGRGLNVEVEGRSWFEVYHNHQGSDDWHRWKRRQQAEHGRPGSTRKNLNLILRIRNFPSRKADAWKAGTLSLGGEVKFYSALQLCLTSPHSCRHMLQVLHFKQESKQQGLVASYSFKDHLSHSLISQRKGHHKSRCAWGHKAVMRLRLEPRFSDSGLTSLRSLPLTVIASFNEAWVVPAMNPFTHTRTHSYTVLLCGSFTFGKRVKSWWSGKAWRSEEPLCPRTPFPSSTDLQPPGSA